MTKKLFKRASGILTCFPFLMSVLIPKVFNGSAYTQGEGLPAGPKRHAGYHQEIGDRLTTDARIWNRDGDFEQTVFDTGNIQDHCFIGAPWGNDSWGIEGSSFDNNNPLHRIDWARFVSSGHDAYMWCRKESLLSMWSPINLREVQMGMGVPLTVGWIARVRCFLLVMITTLDLAGFKESLLNII